jgi:hypothetical protein
MSAGKKNDNKSNPIEVIALEISEGVNVLATKLIEIIGAFIQGIIDAAAKHNKGSTYQKKQALKIKKQFKERYRNEKDN